MAPAPIGRQALKIIRLPISNDSDHPLTVFLEPLCLDYTLARGQRIDFEIRCGDETGHVHLQMGDPYVLSVFLEGSAENDPAGTVDGVGRVQMGYQRELSEAFSRR